jgi:hypothetical protein
MRACEEHPCGYGYPRDRIQEIVDRASRPPPEYLEVQRARIREGRERVEELNQNVAFERLYRPRGELAHADSSASVADASSATTIRPPRSREIPSPPSTAEADERVSRTATEGETLVELAKSVRPDRRGGVKGSGPRPRRSSMVAYVEVCHPLRRSLISSARTCRSLHRCVIHRAGQTDAVELIGPAWAICPTSKMRRFSRMLRPEEVLPFCGCIDEQMVSRDSIPPPTSACATW